MSRKSINVRTCYRIVGSDYSAQEPRCTTFLSGDEAMYEAYVEKKDLYAMIAQSAFNNRYEDNLEFYPEGTDLEVDGKMVTAGYKTHLNKEGKARRAVGKTLLLASTYGMGASAAGARLNKTAEEGAALLDSFFAGFPKVKEAIEQSKEFLKEHGYVEDLVGRRRRLDDISLEPYKAQLKDKEASDADFNPFLACKDRETSRNSEKAWMQILSQYILLSNASKAASAIMERRKPEGERVAAKCAFEDKNEIPNQTFDKLAKLARNPEYLSRQMWATNGKRTHAQKVADDALTVRRLLTTGEYSFYEPSTKRKAVINIASELPEFAPSLTRYTSAYGMTVQTEIPQEPTVLSAYTGRIAQAARQCFNSRIQGCLDGSTEIITKELGPQRIGDLREGVYTLWDGHDWTRGEIVASGKKQKCVLTTGTGHKIVCSPDHKFQVINTYGTTSFKALKDMKSQDRLVLNSESPKCDRERQLLSEKKYALKDNHTFGGKAVVCVKSIEMTDEYVDMYDVCDTERGYFVANGFITHNSSASLTKMAMVDIANDPQLKEWGAELIITVHDEVLVECPEIYADAVEKRLPEIMIAAAKKLGNDVPQACDPYNVTRWYSDVMAATVQEEFKKLEHKGLSRDESLQKVIEGHSEIPAEVIVKTIETGCDLDF